MIVIDKYMFSPELWEKDFVCNLQKCKGQCCVEGESGAPVEASEIPHLQAFVEEFGHDLSDEAQAIIAAEGVFVKDEEGLKTPLMESGACVFIHTDANGLHSCAIEQRHRAGEFEFQKPISCHLYPIRIEKYGQFEAFNYERWDICSAACTLGKELQIPIYKFTQSALERKIGIENYAALEASIANYKSNA